MITSITGPRQVVNIGGTLGFASFVTSATPASYQWKRNGLPIPGATASAHSFSQATPLRDSGWYQLVVTNSSGVTASAAIFVNVVVPVPQIVVWGSSQNGQANVPAGLTGVSAISAGFSHSLALKSDGTVVAWGANTLGQASVPAGLGNVVAIAAANSGSLALKADGTVVGWGNVTVPAGLSGVVAISSDTHSLALRADGTVVAWGDNSLGQANVPAGLSGVIAIAAGGTSSLALRADGTVVAWGSNIYGQASVPAGLGGVAAIAVSDRGFALKADGSVAIWGAGLNVGQTKMPAGVTGVAAISARSVGNLALMAESTVLAWGGGTVPIGLSRVVAIAMGDTHAVALRDASGATPPVISAQPASQSAILGQAVTFSIGATAGGAATLSYQWRKDGMAIPGAVNGSYAIPQVAPGSGGNYDVLVSNYVGAVTSAAATLTIVQPPAIAAQPAGLAAVAGQPASFSVAVAGGQAATYQWQKNGANIPGATGATYTIAAPQPEDAGAYTCIVTNIAGSVTSAPAVLTVLPGARLANASVRTTLAATQSVIVGFVVSGGAKDVLVRAAGPALAQFGLATAMSDPRLELYKDSTKIIENDNWPGVLAGTFASVGAFSFSANSRDSALLQNVSGGHSAVVSGSGPGVVLVEAYDIGGVASARLANISARNRVGTGADILIAGFSIAGGGTKRVLVRAVGPTIGGVPFNVPGALVDPRLELYDGAGVKILENDNWDSSLAPIFTSVGAFPFAPGSKDAALVAILAAGSSYSAQVKGSDGGTGEALVEIYELP